MSSFLFSGFMAGCRTPVTSSSFENVLSGDPFFLPKQPPLRNYRSQNIVRPRSPPKYDKNIWVFTEHFPFGNVLLNTRTEAPKGGLGHVRFTRFTDQRPFRAHIQPQPRHMHPRRCYKCYRMLHKCDSSQPRLPHRPRICGNSPNHGHNEKSDKEVR